MDIKELSLLDRTPIDKVVRTFIGTFNAASQTTSIVGSAATIRIYTIPHGLTRPLLCDMQWSLDGTTWYDQGVLDTSLRGSLAYSTVTDVVIVSPVSSGTVYYRVWGAWIDDYDLTNPLVDITSNNNSPLIYDSRDNIQKIYDYGVLAYTAGTFGSAQTVTVPHSLGYQPDAKGWFESQQDEIWPLIAGGLSNPYSYSYTQDEALARIYNDRVDFIVIRFSNANRRIWYRIYYDAN